MSAPSIHEADGTIREGRSIPTAGLLAPAMHQRRLSFIWIDHQVRLVFGDTHVTVESAFTLTTDRGEHALDPEDRAGLGPLLAEYPATLASMEIRDDATLVLVLESGATLTVPPHPRYEAWQIAGPGTRLIVCEGGGSRVSIWD